MINSLVALKLAVSTEHGTISKLECIGSTFLWDFSEINIDEKGTEAGPFWNPWETGSYPVISL